MVKKYPPYHDTRLGRTCFHCGRSSPEIDDHVPPKAFLDKPYPDNLITVPSCAPCNSATSDDEQYVASLIEVVVCGTTDPGQLRRDNISRTLKHSPLLRKRLDQAATIDNGTYTVYPEQERVDRVMEKIACGLWRFETMQDTADLKAVVSCNVTPLMDAKAITSFFSSGLKLSGWGEIGSRGFIRSICAGDESRYGPGWEDVQRGRFSFAVDSGGDRVRMIFSDYLFVTSHMDLR